MRITSGGELLINTTSDAGDYKLQVNGNTYGVGNYYMNFSQDALTRLHIRNINTGGAAYVETTFETANGQGAVGKLGPNISYKTSSANSTFLYNGATYGDISILNDNGTGKIVMAAGGSSTAQFTLTSSGNVETTGSIKTAAPSGGTAAAWKLGERVASAGVTFNDQQYIQLRAGNGTQKEHREERPAMVEAEPTPPIEEKVERRVVVAKRPRLGGFERHGGPPGPQGGITGGFSPNGGLHAGDSGEFGKRGR